MLLLFFWEKKFSILSSKPINFMLLCLKNEQRFKIQIHTFSIKSNEITTIMNIIQENNNAIFKILFSLWCTNNNFFKRFYWESNNILRIFVHFLNIKMKIVNYHKYKGGKCFSLCLVIYLFIVSNNKNGHMICENIIFC